MRQGFMVLLTLLASPYAVAECKGPIFGVDGSAIVLGVSKQERRDLDSLLGTPIDAVACGQMRRAHGLFMSLGFFVLTADEALFVSNRKVKEILFRAHFPGVRRASVLVHPDFNNTQHLSLETADGLFEFELGCDLAAQRVVDELDRRTAGPMRPPPTRNAPQPACK